VSDFKRDTQQEVDDLYKLLSLSITKFRDRLLKVDRGVVNILLLLVPLLNELIPALTLAIPVWCVVAKQVEVLVTCWPQEGRTLSPLLGK
jgi:hypothetical protein